MRLLIYALGGEKARLALGMIVWKNPNILILDEPTNHLDSDMCHSLALALQRYDDEIILVRHDRYLLRNYVEQLLFINEGIVSEYLGDLDTYEHWTLSSGSKERNVLTSNQVIPTQNSLAYKEKRWLKARKRAEIPL